MRKSVLQKGGNRPPMETSKPVDFFIPREIWSMEKSFTPSMSSLGQLYTSKARLMKIQTSIEESAVDLKERLQKLESEYEKKLDQERSDLKYAQDVKGQEFRHRRNTIIQYREKALADTLKGLRDYKEERTMNFEKEYKMNLETYKKLIAKCDAVLEDNKIQVLDETKVPVLPDNGESPQDLEETLEYIEELILDQIDKGIVVKSTWEKVKGMHPTDTKVAGGLGALALLVATPLVLAGAGVAVATGMKLNKDARNKVVEYSHKILAIKALCKERYDKAKRVNTIDLSEITEEFNLRYKAIEDQNTMSLQTLEEEEREWEKEYEEMKANDRSNIYREELEAEKKRVIEVQRNQYNSQKQVQEEQKKKFDLSKSQFDKDNVVPELMDDFDQEIYDKISEVNKLVQEHLKFRNLSRLNYNLEEDLEGVDRDLADKIKYDTVLYREEYLPLKEKLEKEAQNGRTEEVLKSELERLSRMEDKLFILNTNKLHLGELVQQPAYESLGYIEQVTSDWDNSSVLFIYKNEEEERVLINYVKYLSQQIISQMHVTALQVNILNPTRDTSFNDIVVDSTQNDTKRTKLPYVDTYIGPDIANIKQELDRQVKSRQYGDLIGGKTITEVIRKKRIEASKTPKFYLNIMHRVPIDDELMVLNENSKELGILNFCLIQEDDVVDKSDNGPNKIKSDTANKLKANKVIVTVADILNGNECILNIFNKDNAKYRQVKYSLIGSDVFNERRKYFQQRYLRSLQNSTGTLIDEYINRVVGKNMWGYSAHENIELHLGYVNGDKTRPEPVVLDENEMVHMFIGGTTGGGKSVLLSALANVLKMMYPPSELEIVYYDFKQVEVALHAKPYKWANAKVMAGSSSGEYFKSVLLYLQDEMSKRYSQMKKLGVNKLSSYQKVLRRKRQELIDSGDLDKARRVIIPKRMVVIMDEVQEGFQIDDNTTEALNKAFKALSKVARAAGMHMILLSQNPEGAVPSVVLDLFRVRGCTKASPDLSKAILRNDFSALPENQFMGFFGVNYTPTGESSGNIQYLVPFSSEDHSQLYSKISSDMADSHEEEKSVNAVLFDETDPYTMDDLEEHIKNYPPKEYEILLGYKVIYQQEDEPARIKLEIDQAENISFISAEKDSKVNFFKTLMKSINYNNNKTIVFFGKHKDESYQVENNVQNHILMRTVYTNVRTGVEYCTDEEVDDIIPGTEVDEKTGEKIEPPILGPNGIEYLTPNSIANGLYTEKSVPRLFYDASDYKKRPRYGSDEDNETLTGIMTTLYNGLINKQINERKQGLPTKPMYIIVIDPEKDAGVIVEKDWVPQEFQALVNEACSNAIYTITITSNLTAIGDRAWNRRVIGKTLGSAADSDTDFKKLKPELTLAKDKLDPSSKVYFKLIKDDDGEDDEFWISDEIQ